MIIENVEKMLETHSIRVFKRKEIHVEYMRQSLKKWLLTFQNKVIGSNVSQHPACYTMVFNKYQLLPPLPLNLFSFTYFFLVYIFLFFSLIFLGGGRFIFMVSSHYGRIIRFTNTWLVLCFSEIPWLYVLRYILQTTVIFYDPIILKQTLYRRVNTMSVSTVKKESGKMRKASMTGLQKLQKG